ncbi:MAG: AAA family ATPase [Planctomycetaceae bacterium]
MSPRAGWSLMIVDQLFKTSRFEVPSSMEPTGNGEFVPSAPESLRDTGLTEGLVESLILKFLLNRSTSPGLDIARQLKLPFKLIEVELRRLKREQLIAHRQSSQMHDYLYELTPTGNEIAQRYAHTMRYFGAAPIPYSTYMESVQRQRLNGTTVTPERLKDILHGLSIQPHFFQQVGQAIRSARALFLFGAPGNGKTTIAERICSAYGPRIWIPRTVVVDGELMRVYDPTVHKLIKVRDEAPIDHRWVCIQRPTVVAGGELTLENLEITKIGDSGVVESPLQIKSNCGVLVIDDFGRQRCSPAELLNRWIVPLEMKVDYLNLPSGKKLKTPFEQMIVFSTNLKPRELVDEAFLRRIPYKVEARGPANDEFLRLLQSMAAAMHIDYQEAQGQYLLTQHFGEGKRELRYCHARDLLQQAKTACEFQGRPPEFTTEIIDQAVQNYFVQLD